MWPSTAPATATPVSGSRWRPDATHGRSIGAPEFPRVTSLAGPYVGGTRGALGNRSTHPSRLGS
jgi:hypothetical protein